MKAFLHIRREQIRRFHIEHYTALNNINPHFHSHIEIVLINRGKTRLWINDTEQILNAGELVMLPSYAPHQFQASQDTVDCTVLFIPPFLCSDFMEAIAGKNISAPIVCDAESIKTIQGAVARLENKDMNAIEQTGYIHVILGTVLRYIPLENNAPQGDIDLATKIFLYINEHFKEKLSTEHIARELGYSPRYVAERFRTDFHIGISRYINTVRLKNALSLIRENKYTVTECAMESGFSSLRTFYRVFTEECGCSPKEYFKTE